MVITIAGCWHSPTRSAVAPITNSGPPRAHRPALPEVADAEVGVWENDGTFHPTAVIPLYAGSGFGWRIRPPCTTPRIKVDERLVLPAPGEWHDPDLEVSADRTSVRMRFETDCSAGWIEQRWTVNAGDPPGTWVIRVAPEGFAPRTFRATFTRDFIAPYTAPTITVP